MVVAGTQFMGESVMGRSVMAAGDVWEIRTCVREVVVRSRWHLGCLVAIETLVVRIVVKADVVISYTNIIGFLVVLVVERDVVVVFVVWVVVIVFVVVWVVVVWVVVVMVVVVVVIVVVVFVVVVLRSV